MLASSFDHWSAPNSFGGRDLQHDRLRRDLDGRHRDLVVRAEILDRFDVGIAADQRHRLRRGGDDALDAAAGAIPQQQQIAGAGVEDIDAAGQQRVGLRAATAQNVIHLVVTPGTPRAAACFSISFCFSMMCEGM